MIIVKNQNSSSVECQKLAKKHGVSVEHIQEQLDIGKKEEMEHTDRQFEARKIALEHLSEDPDYYTKLKDAGLVEKALKTHAQKKFDLVMHEFEVGALKDSHGNFVTDKDQALAIAYSESGMSKSIIVKVKERFKKLIIRKAQSQKKAGSGRIVTIAELKRLAGNTPEYDHKYKLQGRMQWHGLNIAIENKKGSYRTGKDPDGKPWKTYMNFDYGRIGGSKAVDNEGVDIYIGPDDTAEMVYVVHQQDPFTRRYDEDKVLFFFPSKESAIEGYLSQYDRPDFLGPVSEFTIPEFKTALKEKRGTMLYRSPNAFRKKIIVRKP